MRQRDPESRLATTLAARALISRGTDSLQTRRWRELDSNHRYPAKFFWLPRPCRAGDVAPPAASSHPDHLPASGEREYSVVLIRPDRRDCRAGNSVKSRMAALT